MRFRHFTGMGADLDDQINSWIQSGADIHFMSHTELADGTITVCFVFQEGFAAQERRMTSEHGLRDAPPVKPQTEPIHVESEGVE